MGTVGYDSFRGENRASQDTCRRLRRSRVFVFGTKGPPTDPISSVQRHLGEPGIGCFPITADISPGTGVLEKVVSSIR